jgi:acetylornithine/N-succinyldiaminopimelate aminotransferase
MNTFNTNAIMPITNRPDAVMVRGEGSWLYDHMNRAYLDLVQGWAVNCLGHSPAVLVDALTTQARLLINPSPAFFNGPMAMLSERLAALSGLDHVFFTNSGAEANEGAIKLARKWGALHKSGAYKIITMQHGFHGRTLATMSASGKEAWESLFEPKVPGFSKVPLNDSTALAAAVDSNTVAIMLELVQGEGGVIPVDEAFVAEIRRLADLHNLLVIVDEVQTGVGRTGTFLASEHWDIRPDIVTLGKGLGGGIPIAAMIAKKEISCFVPGDQGGTYNGNPLMTAGALAVVNTVAAPLFLADVVERGLYFSEKLQAFSDRFGQRGIRGRGLLLALLLADERGDKLVAAARDKGLLINAPRPSVLRFMPALTISKSEIDQAFQILAEVFSSVSVATTPSA